MAIINRNLDASQQRDVFQMSFGALATGVTQVITPIAFPCSLDAAQIAAFGTSGAPTVQLFIHRFIAGLGFTNFSLTSAQAVVAYGTSGVAAAGYSLPAMGSTLTQLQTNDVVMLLTAGSNSAVTGLAVGLVLRPTAEKTTYFGIV